MLVSNDAEMLTVEFESTEGSLNIDMIYLHVGPLDAVPLDGDGTYPAFWEFDHQYADVAVASHIFQMPLAELDDCFMVLAQARFNDGQDNLTVTWSQGVNPDWTAGPFYTYYCVEFCTGDTTGTTTDPDKDPGVSDTDKDQDGNDGNNNDDRDDDDDDDDENDDEDDDDDDDDDDED
jgi:hypothetical protein